MKKIYSIIGILALTMTVNAQTNNRSIAVKKANVATTNPINSVTTPTTTSLVPPSFGSASTCSFTAYSGSSGDGYVTGSNAYGDYGKAQQYNLADYGLSTPATVVAAAIFAAIVDDSGAGYTVKVDIYSDNSGAPGTLLGSSTPVNLSAVTAGTTTAFVFPTPVNLTTSTFYVSLDISGVDPSTGDTIAVAQTDDGCADNVDGGWDYWNDGTWIKFSDPNNWGFTSTDLAIFPVVSADVVTGIKSNTSSIATISPNPSNGVFNISLKSNAPANITVTNAIGQVVANANYTSTEAISLDLSNQNNGIYFVTITNNESKTIKKVVLNK